MSIDDVISRARQPGGYSERREFSVARQRGIRKMREFALADPHYYILELFQAAVANAASHVDIQVSESTLSFSYVGGGYAREELAQIFDYLFASKKDVEHGDIRQLAVGVNALMLTSPDRIIIESGQGTLSSTNRITIHGERDTVEVGTPEEALEGTFIRVEGIDRGAIAGRSTLEPMDYGPPECRAIENRCLAAPIPIIVNGNALFGYSSTRTPVLYGYSDVVTFDEGDLYGSIGVPTQRHKRSFRLLTWGCWIESTGHADMDGTPIGGIVSYDRLNKTADHSGIVQDDRFEELWARIRPYARQVVSGEAGAASYSVSRLGGDTIGPGDLRAFMRDHPVIVSVPNDLTDTEARRAKEVGEALGAPVLTVPEDARDALRMLAGTDAEVLEPRLASADTHERDMSVYTAKTHEPPPRPWVTGAVPIEPIAVESLAERIATEELAGEEGSTDPDTVEALTDRLGHQGMVRGQVYTPVEPPGHGELTIRLTAMNRILWEGSVSSPYPGHRLDIDMPAAPPTALRWTPEQLGALAARTVARHRAESLQKATTRALRALSAHHIEPDGTGARLVLAELARSSIKRIRRAASDHSDSTIGFDLIDETPTLNLLGAPICRNLDGEPVSLNALSDQMLRTQGLVYGVVPQVEADLDGLDRSRILDLDLERERLLVSILGEAAYIRIDRRDVLARVERSDTPDIVVRDLATGLREYPDAPLLVEWSPEADESDANPPNPTPGEIEALVRQLIERWNAEDSDAQLRRQAVRHLQHFVVHRHLHADDWNHSRLSAVSKDVAGLPLFLDADHRPCSFRQVVDGLHTETGVIMVEGRSADISALGRLADESAEQVDSRDRPVRQLMMNSWVQQLLEPIGLLRGAFDFELASAQPDEIAGDRMTGTDIEVPDDDPAVSLDDLFVSASIDTSGFDGEVGVPLTPADRPSISVIERQNRRSHLLREPARRFGLIGYIKLDAGSIDSQWKSITRTVERAARRCLTELLEQLPELDPTSMTEVSSPRSRRTVDVLYAFASRHLRLVRNPSGTVSSHVTDALAQRIFDVPLFPTEHGTPVSASRLIREFCIRAGHDSTPSNAVRLPLGQLPDILQTWIDDHLSTSNVVEPARHGADDSFVPTTTSTDAETSDAPENSARRILDGLFRTISDPEIRDMVRDKLSVVLTTPTAISHMAGSHGQPDVVTAELRQDEPFAVGPANPDLVDRLDEAGRAVARSSESGRLILFANAEHRVVARLAQSRPAAPDDGLTEPLAWSLLSAYGALAEVTDTISREDEMRFQNDVMSSLQEAEPVD